LEGSERGKRKRDRRAEVKALSLMDSVKVVGSVFRVQVRRKREGKIWGTRKRGESGKKFEKMVLLSGWRSLSGVSGTATGGGSG